jgi:hypothetical protein
MSTRAITIVGAAGLPLAAALASTGVLAASAEMTCSDIVRARSVVFIGRYGGAQTGEPVNQFSNFLLFLTDRVEVWRESLTSIASRAPFLRNLTVMKEKDVTKFEGLTADEAYQAWKSVEDRLQVLYGTVSQINGRYVITTRVHLGDLEKRSAPTSVVISLPMDEATIGATNDAHTFITYYSLALEARKIGCPLSISIELLTRARETGIDLQRRIPHDREVKRVAGEVDSLLKELSSPGQRPP